MLNFYFNRSRFTFILLLVLASFQFASAQSGSVRGKIVDQMSGEPLIGANVIVQNTNLGAAADIDGNFYMHNVPAGSQTIVVSYIGYVSQTSEITVAAGRTTEVEYKLAPRVLEGQEVLITGQAQGQLSAINQQFSSNTIANVVSKDRIKELPDVNAAETIGRLPGVSIERSGGEANKISIRGLQPKYNAVTVNGVRIPATGAEDRSVDLSIISSNMLDGITLKKANTPDMDADAFGGTVDLKLKEADGFHVSASAQGGYNQLQDYYGNYAFTGSISNRFFDDRLGAIFNFNIDEYDRSADKFMGNYTQVGVAPNIYVEPQNINLRAEEIIRDRAGASLLLDYSIPSGKLTGNAFYNRVNGEAINRVNTMDVAANRHSYMLENIDSTTSVFLGSAGIAQDFDWIKYDVTASYTSSLTDNPGNYQWNFIQENGNPFSTGDVYPGMDPHEIPATANIDTSLTGLQNAYIFSTLRKENEKSLQLNTQLPFNIGEKVKGYVKVGGKFRWLERDNDEEQWGQTNLQYGGTYNNVIVATLRYLSNRYPNDWNWESDSALARNYASFPVSRFLLQEESPRFLNGEYDLGFMIDERLLRQFSDGLKGTTDQYPDNWLTFSTGSLGNDYDGIEHYQAAYIMGEFSWEFLTLIPGVRYEKDYTKYNGQRFRGTSSSGSQPPPDYQELSNVRESEFWLPMIHLIAAPADWIKIRLARTETLTRPDYIQYAPITRIDIYGNYIRAANALLRPSKSENYDASVQIYQNHVGFFTISGFHKKITDLIFQTGYQLRSGIPTPEGSNVPDPWRTNNPWMDTFINNDFPAYYSGFEMEWQTHFWYLPSFLQGIVLNINYTRIFSEIDKQLFTTKRVVTGVPPRTSYIVADTIRTSRMPYQPGHILNVTFGYDYEGFSARISYLLQGDKTAWIDKDAALDKYTGTYYRWDLTLQQKLNWGLQVYANLTNLNKRLDREYRGNQETNASYTEYYGFTMDLGVRFNL